MLHDEWLERLDLLDHTGTIIGPRGLETRELIDQALHVDSRYNVLDVPSRKLNYKFMVAEWLWMMFGRSDVNSIAQYNEVIRRFSDDGVWLTGAYGPHIGAQKERVLRKLKEDWSTRQAVIVIPRPGIDTKDEPCTVSFQYLIRLSSGSNREPRLHCIVSMRSSDAWLGLPYDIFNFAQLQNCFAGALGVKRGWLSMRLGSSHLYEKDRAAANDVLGIVDPGSDNERARATTLYSPDLPGFPPAWLEDVLIQGRYTPNMGFRDGPWHEYAQILVQPTSADALRVLRSLSNAEAR